MGLAGRSIARAGLEEGVIDKTLDTDALVEQYYKPTGSAAKLNKTMLAILRVDFTEDLEFIEQNLPSIDSEPGG